MKWLVTGGVGFIGTNLVVHLIELGHEVSIIDDMSRSGVDSNAAFLAKNYKIHPNVIDVSNTALLTEFLEGQSHIDAIAHLAGQVSLLESIRDPQRDFAINALGTLNVLNFVRTHDLDTAVIGMSSNKVYGDLAKINVIEEDKKYVAVDWPNGFDETLPLDFHGPYGCSKGAADQYLADFSRTYGLRTASLRQSSVYGPHQHPRSDQGWVAHLIGEALHGRSIQLNGIGKQVRDLVHATDLARLITSLAENIEPYATNQFNVGGGPSNAISILELFDWLEASSGVQVSYQTGLERPSDQKVFISNNSAVSACTGWSPQVDWESGLAGIIESLRQST